MPGTATISWGGNKLPLIVPYQGGNNVTQSPTGTYISTDGLNFWCAYSNNYLPNSQSGFYYSSLISVGDQSSTFIGLSTSILNTCEIVFNVNYGVFVDSATNQYRVVNLGTFTLSPILAAVGDYWGLFRSITGVVTAQYLRGGSWKTLHTFPTTSTANLYLSAEGAAATSILVDPVASPNLSI
jgi:hypothetical protein